MHMNKPKNRQTWQPATPLGLAALAELVYADELPPVEERRMIRRLAGLTLDDIGTVLLVNRVSIHQWETGKVEPKGSSLYAYGTALKRLAAIPAVRIALDAWRETAPADATSV